MKNSRSKRERARERERVGFLTKCEASGYARPFPGAMGTNYSCQMNLSFGEPSMFKADGALCAASRPVCWRCAAPLRNTIRECALLTANATSPGPPPHTTYKHLNSVSNISERSRSFFRSQIWIKNLLCSKKNSGRGIWGGEAAFAGSKQMLF